MFYESEDGWLGEAKKITDQGKTSNNLTNKD